MKHLVNEVDKGKLTKCSKFWKADVSNMSGAKGSHLKCQPPKI